MIHGERTFIRPFRSVSELVIPNPRHPARRCGSSARNAFALEVPRAPAQLRNNCPHSRGSLLASTSHCGPNTCVWRNQRQRHPNHPSLNGDEPSPQLPKFDCLNKPVSLRADQELNCPKAISNDRPVMSRSHHDNTLLAYSSAVAANHFHPLAH